MAPSPSVFFASSRSVRRGCASVRLFTPSTPHHPLRLGDEICMLDQMSGGRLELGVGRGISPYEVGYYGVDPATARAFAEALDVILKGLTHPRLDYAGKYFTFQRCADGDEPIQRPHPLLWYGANFTGERRPLLAKRRATRWSAKRPSGVSQFSARYRARRRRPGATRKRFPDRPQPALSWSATAIAKRKRQSEPSLLVRRADPSVASAPASACRVN